MPQHPLPVVAPLRRDTPAESPHRGHNSRSWPLCGATRRGQRRCEATND
jgi:hypothetical protein